MMLAAASTGMLSYLNPVFIETVTSELNIPRATFMVYNTFSTIATVITMPLASSVYKKLPMKLTIILGAILGASSHLCYSLANDVRLFYLGGVLAGIGTCLYGSIPIAILTSNWFHEKKGVVTGIAFSGTGAVSALLSPIVSNVIMNYGYRSAYRLISFLILAVVLPITLFLIKLTPEEMGLLPYGSKQTDVSKEKAGFAKNQIFKTKSFYIFSIAVFLLGAVTGPAQQQLVAYWSGVGNSQAFAASMYSVVMTVAIFTKIFLGAIYDKTSVTKGTIAVGSISVLSYISLIVFNQGYSILFPAVLFGVTVSVQVLVSTYVANRLFGDKEYAFVYGIMTPLLYGGMAVGSPLSASIYDIFGGYELLWTICACIFALAVFLVVASDKISKNEYFKVLGINRK